MFFILSKVFVFLLNPLLWILIGLLIALVASTKKIRKIALIISLSLFILLSNPLLLNQFARQWDVNTGVVDKRKVYSCAIVLGGFSSEDENGEGFFNASADRFIQALKLKSTGSVSHLLITGGNSKIIPGKFRESIWVKDELRALNIADSSILIEPDSRNTLENATFAKRLLERNGLKPPYLLITSAFHMRRSLYTFHKADVQVIPFSSNYIAGRNRISLDDFIPRAEILNKWGVYFKELIGFGIYYVKG
jgi:uncharacterized SAM-binding protein YcdF (DUF218 family)